MRSTLVVSMVLVMLVAIFAVALPKPAAAQLATGGYVDEIVFSVVPQAQAVDQVILAGETGGVGIDAYIFRLDVASDVVRAQQNPARVRVNQAFAGHRGLIFNPCAPASGAFNPFTIREIREAMHWAIDRARWINEFGGGQGLVKVTSQFAAEPNYVREAAFFASLEAQYAFDIEKARAQVNDAMARVPGSVFDTTAARWRVNGAIPELIIISRLQPDPRFAIGEAMKTVLNNLGFDSRTEPSTFARAIEIVYNQDCRLGQWYVYTEGWGSSGFTQFDDTNQQFYYNGDFATALWSVYRAPASLRVAAQALNDGEYSTLEERSELLQTAERLGMREGIRAFIWADRDSHIFTTEIEGTTTAAPKSAYDVFSGNQNPFATRTMRFVPGASRPSGDAPLRGDGTGGTLRIGQPIHTQSVWNWYGGFQDVYSVYQHWAYTDYGVYTHPHLGIVLPIRADFQIESVGPTDTVAVPADAMFFNTTSMAFEQVGPGLRTQAVVDYTFTWGEWHHGAMMSMDDVYANIAMFSRIAEGDVGTANPSTRDLITFVRWADSFRGFNVTGPNSIRVWYDTFNPDTSLIAGRADVWPYYPWELNHLIAESVTQATGGLALSDTDADTRAIPGLDLAKGTDQMADLSARLATHSTANTVPSYLTGIVDSTEATARWAALNAWRARKAPCQDGPDRWTCGFTVSNGPYVLDEYLTQPEGAVYKAKRAGYPFEVNKWEGLTDIKVPQVSLGTAPQVIQTFPANWTFTSTLGGQPYDRLATASWLVFDPATRALLFSGDAIRTGPGTFEIQMSSAQTAALAEGSYELRSIVVGEEAALPVITSRPFSSLSVRTAVLSEVIDLIDEQLGPLRDDLAEQTAAANAASAAANAANNLAQLLLIITSVALVVAVASVGMLAAVWRRVSRMTAKQPGQPEEL